MLIAMLNPFCGSWRTIPTDPQLRCYFYSVLTFSKWEKSFFCDRSSFFLTRFTLFTKISKISNTTSNKGRSKRRVRSIFSQEVLIQDQSWFIAVSSLFIFSWIDHTRPNGASLRLLDLGLGMQPSRRAARKAGQGWAGSWTALSARNPCATVDIPGLKGRSWLSTHHPSQLTTTSAQMTVSDLLSDAIEMTSKANFQFSATTSSITALQSSVFLTIKFQLWASIVPLRKVRKILSVNALRFFFFLWSTNVPVF